MVPWSTFGDGSLESESLELPPAPKVSITHNLLIVFGQFWRDLDSGADWNTFWDMSQEPRNLNLLLIVLLIS